MDIGTSPTLVDVVLGHRTGHIHSDRLDDGSSIPCRPPLASVGPGFRAPVGRAGNTRSSGRSGRRSGHTRRMGFFVKMSQSSLEGGEWWREKTAKHEKPKNGASPSGRSGRRSAHNRQDSFYNRIPLLPQHKRAPPQHIVLGGPIVSPSSSQTSAQPRTFSREDPVLRQR